jgi:hypothetical protein
MRSSSFNVDIEVTLMETHYMLKTNLRFLQEHWFIWKSLSTKNCYPWAGDNTKASQIKTLKLFPQLVSFRYVRYRFVIFQHSPRWVQHMSSSASLMPGFFLKKISGRFSIFFCTFKVFIWLSLVKRVERSTPAWSKESFKMRSLWFRMPHLNPFHVTTNRFFFSVCACACVRVIYIHTE